MAPSMRSTDQLLNELAQVQESPPPPSIQRVRYTHQAMIDLIIANPGISQNAIAAHFGYTPGWISIIFSSDSFRAMLAARREEIIDPVLKASVEEQFQGLVLQSLEVLRKKLESPQVSDNLALEAAKLGSKALGMGAAPPPQAQQPQDHLNSLAERLTGLLTRKRAVIEGEVTDV